MLRLFLEKKGVGSASLHCLTKRIIIVVEFVCIYVCGRGFLLPHGFHSFLISCNVPRVQSSALWLTLNG